MNYQIAAVMDANFSGMLPFNNLKLRYNRKSPCSTRYK